MHDGSRMNLHWGVIKGLLYLLSTDSGFKLEIACTLMSMFLDRKVWTNIKLKITYFNDYVFEEIGLGKQGRP